MRNLIAALLLTLALPAAADPPKVEGVRAAPGADGWRFDVTLSHPDSGWEHYADGWRVLDMDGNELGLRVLFHPHEAELPFTRSLSGAQIPEGTQQVQIQARCLVDGWNTKTTLATLP